MGEGWGKIALCVRANKTVPSEFLDSWTKLLLSGPRKGDMVLPPAIGAPPHVSANRLVNRFMASTADTILFVDDDQLPEPIHLSMLRDNPESWKYDAVSGLIVRRSGATSEQTPVVMRLAGDEPRDPMDPYVYNFLTDWEPGSVVEVDAVGLGFTLIRREVFGAIAASAGFRGQWFMYPNGEGSEDVTFSRKAALAGKRMAVDTSVIVPHGWMVYHLWGGE